MNTGANNLVQSLSTTNKTCKGLSLVIKRHKTSHVSVNVSRSVKRKENTSSTKRDEVCNAKRKKMEKENSKFHQGSYPSRGKSEEKHRTDRSKIAEGRKEKRLGKETGYLLVQGLDSIYAVVG